MRRAIVGSILLVAVAMILGGTVFRDQVANARSLAQSVVVTNPPSQPVPVHEQGTVSVNVTNDSLAVTPPRALQAYFEGRNAAGFDLFPETIAGDRPFLIKRVIISRIANADIQKIWLYVQIKCVCPERDEIPYYLDIPIEVQGGQGMLDLGDGIYVDQNRDRAAVGDAIKFGFATGGDGVTTRGFSALVL